MSAGETVDDVLEAERRDNPLFGHPRPMEEHWTRRDEFAVRALDSLLRCERFRDVPNDNLAAMAWNLADAMESER